MSFAQKNLIAEFSLGTGNFQGGGNNLTIGPGMRMSCEASWTPHASGSSLENLVIYGMTLSQMNQLSVIGKQLAAVGKNSVSVYAQDGDTQPSLVFSGNILQAYIDGNDQPSLRFIVTGRPDGRAARQPIPVTTHKGAYAAQNIAQSLAQAMGFKFENNGVSVMLRNPYLWGTGISQMRQLSRAANFVWGLDARGTLAIWPKGGARAGAGVTISPKISGPGELIGYPVCSQATVYAKAYYAPNLSPFTMFTLADSEFTAANGPWHLGQMSVALDSWTPHGRWEMILKGFLSNQVPSSGSQ